MQTVKVEGEIFVCTVRFSCPSETVILAVKEEGKKNLLVITM